MIGRRRRAVFLIEMLTVVLCVAVGGTLMALSVASIVRDHRRIVEFGNRYAVLNDFLRCLREDVRGATRAEVRNGGDAGAKQVLTVGEPPTQILYRFGAERIARVGFFGDPVADKAWSVKHGVVTVGLDPPINDGNTTVRVTITWRQTAKDDPAPTRRFDTTIRCAGEIRHAPD